MKVEQATDHLLNLSPFEMKTLLHMIISGKELGKIINLFYEIALIIPSNTKLPFLEILFYNILNILPNIVFTYIK